MADGGAVNVRPAWTHQSAAPIQHVAVASSGDALVVSDANRNVTVLDADGTKMGEMRPGQPVRKVICNRTGARFAVLSGDGIVYAFDREGNLEWRVELAGKIATFGMDVPGENVAAVSPEGWLHLYNQATRERLVVPVGVPMTDVAVIGDEPLQTVIATEKGNVAMVDAEGAARWRRELKVPLGNLSLSVPGDLISVAAGDRGLYLYHLDGIQIVNVDLEDLALKSIVADDGKSIMVHTGQSGMRLIDLEGNPKWEMPLDGPPVEWSFGMRATALAIVTADGVLEFYRVGEAAPQEPEPEQAAADDDMDDLDAGPPLKLELEDLLSDEDDLFADVPKATEAAESPDVDLFERFELVAKDADEEAPAKPAPRKAAKKEEAPAAEPPLHAPPPAAKGKLHWKIRLRANALPAAQSLFRMALDGSYVATVLTDGRVLLLDAQGKPIVKEEVGLPARFVPALPGRMVGAWTPTRMLMAQPSAERQRTIEFLGGDVESVDASETFHVICTLNRHGIMSGYIGGDSHPTWQKDVGGEADSIHVSPGGEDIVVADRGGRFRYFTPDGHLKRKFRFGQSAEGQVVGLADDFTAFLRGGGLVTVLKNDGREVFSQSLFKNTVGAELLGRQLAVYGPTGSAAYVDPWSGTVHEMFPPPGKARVRCLPGQSPFLVHMSGKTLAVYSGYKRKLDVVWRYECRAVVEMFDVDMDGNRVAAFAQDRLYWIGPPEPEGR